MPIVIRAAAAVVIVVMLLRRMPAGAIALPRPPRPSHPPKGTERWSTSTAFNDGRNYSPRTRVPLCL